jgi:hypothetical protein
LSKAPVRSWNCPSAKEIVVVATPTESTVAYEAPALVDLGAIAELTLVNVGCTNKDWGSSDGIYLQGVPITCSSA